MIAIPSPRSRKRPRLEIIPLIDIIFFLFATFVMVSLSMVKNSGIPLRLPVAATGAPQDRARSATVSVDARGGLYFDRQPQTAGGLARSLRAFRDASPEGTIFLRGDTDASFGQVVAVLDTLRAAGLEKIAIETGPKHP